MTKLAGITAAATLAVGLTAGTGASAATVYATEVLGAGYGTCSIAPSSQCTADNRTNTNNAVDGDAGTFYALGHGGWLTVAFGGLTFDPTQNVKVTEITFNRDPSDKPKFDHYEAVEIFGVLGGAVVKSFGTILNWGSASVKADVQFDAIMLVDRTWDVFGVDGTSSFDGFDVSGVAVAPVPLPAGGLLLVTALGGLALARRRKNA